MKKHIIDILIIILFLVGLSVFLYPTVSNRINESHASKAIIKYDSAVHDIFESELKQMYEEAEIYNRQLADNPSAFYEPSVLENYNDILNITGNGIMGYISIPDISVELPIYHSVDKSVLQVGIGHLEGSSLPIGGQSTHCVLSGHRGLPSAKLFTDLDKIREGDTFSLRILDRVITYEIDQILTVLPAQTDALQIERDADYCTLMTCTPYGINTHRLLVRGKRLEMPNERPGLFIPNEAFLIESYIIMLYAMIPLLAVLIIRAIVKKVKEVRRK